MQKGQIRTHLSMNILNLSLELYECKPKVKGTILQISHGLKVPSKGCYGQKKELTKAGSHAIVIKFSSFQFWREII